MSLHVLEFNDAGLRLSDASGILLSSPGYAYVNAKDIEFGEDARKQSKVYPLNSFNQFWHKLSLDPFSKAIGNFRHNADIAFSHLQDIAHTTELEGDIVLAVPGSFSREQMAILLGLLKKSAMRPIGLVDAALAASIDHAQQQSVIHVDLQLHQVVLSKLQREGAELRRESVILVPGAGWVNISDNLMQLFTSAFIQQCRFNPQHNAASEQMLLDSLPQWLLEEGSEGANAPEFQQESRPSLEIKLNHNNIVHQASLPRSALQSRLLPFFQKIEQQLAVIDPDGRSSLLISDRMQCLPSFASVFTSAAVGAPRTVTLLGESSTAQSCLRYRDDLIGAPDALHFVSKIYGKQANAPIGKASPSPVKAEPTHLLSLSQARRLTDGLLICVTKELGENQQGLRLVRRDLQEDLTDLQVVGELVREDGQFILQSQQLQINGKTVQGRQGLALGDVLSSVTFNHSIELIRVQEYDD